MDATRNTHTRQNTHVTGNTHATGNTLYVNGKFYTLESISGTEKSRNSIGGTVEAVYVENGRIQAIGSSEDLRLQYGREGVAVVDLEGHTVYPGWVDSHLHLPGLGAKLAALDLSDIRSKDAMIQVVKEKSLHTPEGEWIIGLNWNENLFADRAIPTMDELSAAVPRHPVFLTRTCYHIHVANQAAYRRAGVSEDTSDPSDGAYGRDASSGRLNGLIYENASKPFIEAQPRPTYEKLKDDVRRAVMHALSLGLTGVHTEDLRYLGSVDQMRRIYRELVEEGLPLRTHHLIYHPHMQELADAGLTVGDGDEWLRIGAVKIFADGSIGGRTALLSRPYHDAPHTSGMAMHSQEELNEITLRARKLGMPIAVHAIGDGGAERVVAAMEAVPLGRHGVRHRDRLIHAQIMRADLVDRLRRLHVAVDIQPRFIASDFPWVMDRVGPDRLDYAYAWRKLIDAGLHCAAGSDAPIEPLDPRLGVHAAVTRRNPADNHEGYMPHERLSVAEAVGLFTTGSAYAATEEFERGTISVGKYADFTVTDRDLFNIEHPDEILDTHIIMTVTNGVIGYRREQ